MSTGRSYKSSSISPFRSRKSPVQSSPAVVTKRPVTPTSTMLSKPPSSSRLSAYPSTSSSPAPSSGPSQSALVLDKSEATASKSKENVTVTVRFRPLSPRETSKGDEIAWYADGDCTVRNEYNSSLAYGFDRVFGPATTTRHVYDAAAQHVVSSVMQGINGTVFAYGVTSSGKTHTMHGEQKSPGIIPLAVKDVFGIIQETPYREFLLRVSYLEIYNEVINDLLDSTGQNLRIREDSQGTYVEGIKEEVVLSPAHALSLIASGEAHRHVGSNNFNLLSSRSHTIFTLTIESGPRGNYQGEDVTLSQLHLIDLAGSESSKTETTGLRRKEGSYINKSLLTLGTVISKLTDGKATHVPYRDSKLTRLLQSSLSGHGRVSLICTVTPASSNSEETHNTIKFAHRSKHVEIKASQNKIVDEKSLIKKYQKEISSLKQELQQLKQGMVENPSKATSTQEDLVNLKLQFEAGQVKLQSRLEEEEEAKAALMGRIQRLTKLILVSTKNNMQNIPERNGHRRRHSFAEDELAYLPDRKREYMGDEDAGNHVSELSTEGKEDVNNLHDLVKDYKRNKRHGMLGWFKLRRPENGLPPNGDSVSSGSGSPISSKSSQNRLILSDSNDVKRKSINRQNELTITDSFPERSQAGDLLSATIGACNMPLSGVTISDQMELLQEQMKMLVGEAALCTSSLKRLSEHLVSNPEDSQLKEHMQKLKNEIREKKQQIRVLEQRMIVSVEGTSHASDNTEVAQVLSKLTTQLNEKLFELEIMFADNRILQEQLQVKTSENAEMQENILLLRQQLSSLSEKGSIHEKHISENEYYQHGSCSENLQGKIPQRTSEIGSDDENYIDEATSTSMMSLNKIFSERDHKYHSLKTQVLSQAAEIENLYQEKVRHSEVKEGLEIQSRKLSEEASYAKELAGAAAHELQNLAEEVTRLSYENAKLIEDLTDAKETHCRSSCCQKSASYVGKQTCSSITRIDEHGRNEDIVAKMIKSCKIAENISSEAHGSTILPSRVRTELDGQLFNIFKGNASFENMSRMNTLEELRVGYQIERRRCKDLENYISKLKGENISGLDVVTLEELKNFHVEAITNICPCKEYESCIIASQFRS